MSIITGHRNTTNKLSSYRQRKQAYQYLTQKMVDSFRKMHNQNSTNESLDDIILIAKYFMPDGSWTWYASEYDEFNEIFFGYVTGTPFPEWGSFSLEDIESIRIGSLRLPIERDIHWTPKRFGDFEPHEKGEYC